MSMLFEYKPTIHSFSHNHRAVLQHLPCYVMPEAAGVWVTALGKHRGCTSGVGLVVWSRFWVGKGGQEAFGEIPYIVLEASRACGGIFVFAPFPSLQKRAPLIEQWLGKGRNCVLKETFFITSVAEEKKLKDNGGEPEVIKYEQCRWVSLA